MDPAQVDFILTEFIERTKADPALAQDLLEATEWNLDSALAAYDSLHDTKAVGVPEYEYNPSESIGGFHHLPVCWGWVLWMGGVWFHDPDDLLFCAFGI